MSGLRSLILPHLHRARETRAGTSAPAGARLPWTFGDLRRIVTMQALGLGTIVVGWYGASGRAAAADQVAWLNVGVAGEILAATANAAFLLRGYRGTAHRRRLILGCAGLTRPAHAPGAPVPVPRPSSSELPVATRSMTLYHRPDCIFAAGKTVSASPRGRHERAGRRPCPWCEP